MSTTTHRIPLSPEEYTNVSNGNLNCTLVVPTDVQLRLVFAGETPDPDTKDYVLVQGPGTASQGRRASIVTAANLVGESDMWVSGDAEVMVFRGEGVVAIMTGG
jgi:hypothetical protein